MVCLIGVKCLFMVCVDVYGEFLDGVIGKKFVEEIMKKIEKW